MIHFPPLIITQTHFYQYSVQPAWIWYDKFGDHSKKESLSDFGLKLIEDAQRHKEYYVGNLKCTHVLEDNPHDAYLETCRLMSVGVDLIYKGCIYFEYEGIIYRGQPSLLEKRSGRSSFGDWYYAPVEIGTASKADQNDLHQLAFYAFILEQIQGIHPHNVSFVNGASQKISLILDAHVIAKTRSILMHIIAITRGAKPEVTINSEAKKSPWHKIAREEAHHAQDIGLVYKLDRRSVPALRDAGINTLIDLVQTDVTSIGKIPYSPIQTLKKHQLQAKALVYDEVIHIDEIALPDSFLKIYFDIEGSPTFDIDYLFGFWISGDHEKRYAQTKRVRFYDEEHRYFVYFLAEDPAEEKDMWFEFLEWLGCLPDEYTVYHYANYEKQHLQTLAQRYGTSRDLVKFQSMLVDLQKVVSKSVIFPLYSYSIKDIAKSKFINFTWRHHKANGGQSILWFDQWLITGNRDILNDIINYNEDDVRATEALFEWLANQQLLTTSTSHKEYREVL